MTKINISLALILAFSVSHCSRATQWTSMVATSERAVTAKHNSDTTSQNEESSAACTLVPNGNFEAPVIGAGTWQSFGGIPGWNLSLGPSIEVQHRVAGSPFEGNQFVELDSEASSGIFQIVSTNPGQNYRLQFMFSARPGQDSSENLLEVRWNGVTIGTLSSDGASIADTNWVQRSFTVTAAGRSSRLEFIDRGSSNSLGTYLDRVCLDPVP